MWDEAQIKYSLAWLKEATDTGENLWIGHQTACEISGYIATLTGEIERLRAENKKLQDQIVMLSECPF